LFALRIDVDTFEGLTQGVPKILDILRQYDIKASFYCTMGREVDLVTSLRHKIRSDRVLSDFSNKNLHQTRELVQQLGLRGSLSEISTMLMKNPISLINEGRRLSKSFLLPKKIGREGGDILKQIADEKHEIGPHGYIHIKWSGINLAEMTEEFEEMISEYFHIFKRHPKSWCSPFGTLNDDVVRLTEKYQIAVNSYLGGTEIFHPIIDGRQCNHIMVPVTTCATVTKKGIKQFVPLLQHFKSVGLSDFATLKRSKQIIEENMRKNKWASTFVHAEFEGLERPDLFRDIVKFVKNKGYDTRTFVELGDSFEGLQNRHCSCG
jgi:peptidoglycan/xylan/chitin deacetylase (PgdA/CDA1 family)